MGQKGFATTQLFKAKTLNFESLGIGGLDKQFDAIFRRAFASRVFPPSIVQRLGIQHVKVRTRARGGRFSRRRKSTELSQMPLFSECLLSCLPNSSPCRPFLVKL